MVQERKKKGGAHSMFLGILRNRKALLHPSTVDCHVNQSELLQRTLDGLDDLIDCGLHTASPRREAALRSGPNLLVIQEHSEGAGIVDSLIDVSFGPFLHNSTSHNGKLSPATSAGTVHNTNKKKGEI
jgi:hypothetical protein